MLGKKNIVKEKVDGMRKKNLKEIRSGSEDMIGLVQFDFNILC